MPYIEDGKENVLFKTTPGRKAVFLIGDSMRVGSCAATAESLADIADVVYPRQNCRDAHFIIYNLYTWSKQFDGENIDVVHFNCGQWDSAHFNHSPEPLATVEEYEKSIRTVIWNLRTLFPKAQLVYATTTPINPDESTVVNSRNPRYRADIVRYNEAGKKVAREEGILIDDIFYFCEDWPTELYKDMCHFTEEGFAKMGRRVADYLRPLLEY